MLLDEGEVGDTFLCVLGIRVLQLQIVFFFYVLLLTPLIEYFYFYRCTVHFITQQQMHQIYFIFKLCFNNSH
jgi:hypothetical protein